MNIGWWIDLELKGEDHPFPEKYETSEFCGNSLQSALGEFVRWRRFWDAKFDEGEKVDASEFLLDDTNELSYWLVDLPDDSQELPVYKKMFELFEQIHRAYLDKIKIQEDGGDKAKLKAKNGDIDRLSRRLTENMQDFFKDLKRKNIIS